MFLAGNVLVTLAQILSSFARLYTWIIFGAVVVSWVGADPYNPIVRFLRTMVDPPCGWIRRRFPFVVVGGFVDLSPIALLAALQLVEGVVVASLIQYGRSIL